MFSNNPASATCVNVTSWSSPKFNTAPSAINKSENSAELVPRYAPSAASGTIPVLLVISFTVIEVAPVIIPASTLIVPSKTIDDPEAGVILTPPDEVLKVTAASP